MTREEHLNFCKICKSQKFDPKKGVICGLTGKVADFEGTCDSFEEDAALKVKVESNKALSKTASRGKRFANYILDRIFFSIIIFILSFILGLFLPAFTNFIIEDSNIAIFYLLFFIVAIVYYSTFEIITGRTIAKYITKTKVVDENGNKPKYSAILLRTLSRFIPFEPFSFLFSADSGWHDRLSKTTVIDV